MTESKRVTAEQAARWLDEGDNFLILTHRRPDGDTLGCAAGLCRGLRELGKAAYVLENPETTDRYRDYVAPYTIAHEEIAAALIVAVDTATEDMLAKNAQGYRGKVDLCIDHHPSNSAYGGQLCLYPDRAACGEIIYEILMELAGGISAETALPLYVALSTDTGCFAYGNTTDNTLLVASRLVAAGADHGQVNKRLFRTKSRGRIALDGLLLTGMRYFEDGKIAVSTLTRRMREETGVTENDLDDIAALPGQIEGVIVGITIKEVESGDYIKVSVRTSQAVDANAICSVFGGGGHRMAAGCHIKMSTEDAVQAIAAAAIEAIV